MYGFPGKTQLPKSKKSDDVIALRCTCIQVAVLYWENHLKQFMLGFMPVDNSDYLTTYVQFCQKVCPGLKTEFSNKIVKITETFPLFFYLNTYNL